MPQVELRNRRFEEHSALVESCSFLRRRKRRGLSCDSRFINTTGASDPHKTRASVRDPHISSQTASTTPAIALGTGVSTTGGVRPRESVVPKDAAVWRDSSAVLHKPESLDLPAILAAGVIKNQAADAGEAFRAVGLVRPGGIGSEVERSGGGGGYDPLASPPIPHFFWKAVLVVPARSRGNVGAWLEAKLGGGQGGKSSYVRDVASISGQEFRGDGATHAAAGEDGVINSSPHARDDMGQEDEVPCGNGASSRLVHLALR